MSYYLSPIGNDQQTDANGNPLVGGKIYTYQAGTSTPYGTYTDSTSGTLQANPIILNSLGLPTSPIWMAGGVAVKYVVKDSSDVMIRTVDNVIGVNDTTNAASEWLDLNLVPTYLSATQFSVPGDQTAVLQVNRRVRTRNTGGYIYGRITVATYGSSVTTVTVVNDSGTLDSGLSLVSYGFLSYSPTSLPYGIYAGVGANSDITSLSALATVPTVVATYTQQLQPISASVSANALTISASALSLDFRSATLGSGATTRVTGTPANLVISSGSTLGTTSAVASRIVVLALNNAGTIELAAVNIAGGNDLSETGLISTTAEGGAGAADSASVVYSTTARTSVAYRVIGYIDSTQATAGTWATAPSTIQGAGGNAVTAMSSLGYGQTWQNVSGSRATATTYYNTTGRPIYVAITDGAGTTSQPSATVNALTILNPQVSVAGSSNKMPLTFVVPAGGSYSASNLIAGFTWYELR